MGSTNKYDEKRLVSVQTTVTSGTGATPGTPTPVLYGFWTNLEGSASTILGHTLIDVGAYQNPPTGLMIGANFPKPSRASKRIGTEIASSYCSSANARSLATQGWRVTPPKKQSPLILATEASKLVQSVYIRMRGIKYGWQMPKETRTRITSVFATLGIVDATEADRNELVFGPSFPKPPKVKGSIGVTTGGTTVSNAYSTYYDPSVTLPADWEHFKNAVASITNKR